jgi:hypothetical protein
MNDTPPRVTPLTGAGTDALRRFADAVLDARDGYCDNVKLHTERAGELATDPIRAALCRGQAMAYQAAAEQIDDALSIATGRWGQGQRT